MLPTDSLGTEFGDLHPGHRRRTSTQAPVFLQGGVGLADGREAVLGASGGVLGPLPAPMLSLLGALVPIPVAELEETTFPFLKREESRGSLQSPSASFQVAQLGFREPSPGCDMELKTSRKELSCPMRKQRLSLWR